uniref:Uncharacterized protein n=1 Tax=Rhizophora mucronata TaxID=61149 RepID=A0A2P2QXC4_RHIMU
MRQICSREVDSSVYRDCQSFVSAS